MAKDARPILFLISYIVFLSPLIAREKGSSLFSEEPSSDRMEKQDSLNLEVSQKKDPWQFDLHGFAKSFYYGKDQTGKSSSSSGYSSMGYLRLSLEGDLSFQDQWFWYFEGRISAYRSGETIDDQFVSTFLSSSSFDFVDAERTWNRGKTSINSADFKEFWFKYEGDSFSARLGRQVLNWGEGRFFNPVNVVTRSSPYTLEMDEVRGSDGISATWFFTGNIFLDFVWTAHNSENNTLSFFAKQRRYRTLSFSPLTNDELASLLIDKNESVLLPDDEIRVFRFSSEVDRVFDLAERQEQTKDRPMQSMYQDAALRLKGPILKDLDGALIGGYRARRSYLGFDLAMTSLGAAFRAGTVAYSAMKMDRDVLSGLAVQDHLYDGENQPFAQWYIGADYTWSRYLTGSIQYFYNTGALKNKPWTTYGLYNTAPDSGSRDVHDFLRGGYVTYNPAFLNVSFNGDVTDLVGYQVYIFYDVEGKGIMGILGATASISDFITFQGGVRFYSSDKNKRSDFSGMAPDLYGKFVYTLF